MNKHKFDLSEIETDEQIWLLNKFRRDHYVMCAVVGVILAIIILI